MILRLYCQLVHTYQCPRFPSTWLHILGGSLGLSATFPLFLFKGVLRHSWALCLQPSQWKHTITLHSHFPWLVRLLPPPLILLWFLFPFLLFSNGQGCARCSSLMWTLKHHPQLHDLFFWTCDVIFPFQLNWSHSDSIPGSVLLLRLSIPGHCQELRAHYPLVSYR